MSQTHELFMMAGIWTVIAVVIACFIKNWPGRIAFLAIAVGLPFWELPYGFYNFQKLCREEVSLKVSGKVPPQDSVCIEYFDSSLYRQLVQAGFSQIEIVGRSDNAKEYAASGRVFLVDRGQATSAYCITFKNNIPLQWRVLRADTLIERVTDKNVIGRQSEFHWAGMWWQEMASPVFGRGGSCSKVLNQTVSFLRRGTD